MIENTNLKGEEGKELWTGVEVVVVGWEKEPDNEVMVASPSDDLVTIDFNLIGLFYLVNITLHVSFTIHLVHTNISKVGAHYMPKLAAYRVAL